MDTPRNEETVYIRQWDEGWEAFAKAKGEGFIMQTQESREETIRLAKNTLWALITFGPDDYQKAMAGLKESDYPDTDFPVVEEPPRE